MGSGRTNAGADAERVAHPETSRAVRVWPHQVHGTADTLYKRYLLFDNVVDPAAIGPRERYEVVARSVRGGLSQHWLRTENTYERLNPKHAFTTSSWSV